MLIDIHTHKEPLCTDKHIALRNTVPEDWCTRVSTSCQRPFSCGIHPWSVKDQTLDSKLEQLREIASSSRCAAIGECGLDTLSDNSTECQRTVLIEQISLAEMCRKPLVLHVVRAWSELFAAFNARSRFPYARLIHGFRGKASLAKQLIDHGFLLGFGRYYHLDSLSLAFERHALLLESDNSPCAIKDIYRQAAGDLVVSPGDLSCQIETTARAAFPLLFV